MTSPFEPLRSPTRWRNVTREYPFGAHYQRVAERLFALIMFDINDFVLDLDLRTSPRLALIGRAKAQKRGLTVSFGGVVLKRLPVKLDETGVLIGERYLILNDEGGVMRLVNAITDVAEAAWNRQGR